MSVVLRCRRGHALFLASSEHRIHPMQLRAICAKCRGDRLRSARRHEQLTGDGNAGAGDSTMDDR